MCCSDESCLLVQGQGHTIECGNLDEAWADCAHIVDGTAYIGGQVRRHAAEACSALTRQGLVCGKAVCAMSPAGVVHRRGRASPLMN